MVLLKKIRAVLDFIQNAWPLLEQLLSDLADDGKLNNSNKRDDGTGQLDK